MAETPAKAAYIGRRNAIPVIYARGTHYEVGYDVVGTNSYSRHQLANLTQNYYYLTCIMYDFTSHTNRKAK